MKNSMKQWFILRRSTFPLKWCLNQILGRRFIAYFRSSVASKSEMSLRPIINENNASLQPKYLTPKSFFRSLSANTWVLILRLRQRLHLTSIPAKVLCHSEWLGFRNIFLMKNDSISCTFMECWAAGREKGASSHERFREKKFLFKQIQ